MKRWFLVCAVLLTGIFLAGTGLSATYDITGEWDYTDYDTDCDGTTGTEQGTDIIIQNGNNFTLISDDRTVTGTVSGNVYTATATWYEEEGWVTATFKVTASSNIKY